MKNILTPSLETSSGPKNLVTMVMLLTMMAVLFFATSKTVGNVMEGQQLPLTPALRFVEMALTGFPINVMMEIW